jgi:hypothetical protein
MVFAAVYLVCLHRMITNEILLNYDKVVSGRLILMLLIHDHNNFIRILGRDSEFLSPILTENGSHIGIILLFAVNEKRCTFRF